MPINLFRLFPSINFGTQMDSVYFLIAGVALVAFLYAAVGHGGATGYLAVITIAGLSAQTFKPMVLVLNLLVSLLAFYQYNKIEKVNKPLLLWLCLTSIPAAFIGAWVPINPLLYKKILGVLLLFPIYKLLFMPNIIPVQSTQFNKVLAMFIGLCIGYLSGLIGMGGGIFLSPIVLLLGWLNLKATSTLSALFIAVNSLAGLLALAGNQTNFVQPNFIPLTLVALVFGLIGAYVGAQKFNQQKLRVLLALVLIIASGKLLLV